MYVVIIFNMIIYTNVAVEKFTKSANKMRFLTLDYI
jgi:hypothetical protein